MNNFFLPKVHEHINNKEGTFPTKSLPLLRSSTNIWNSAVESVFQVKSAPIMHFASPGSFSMNHDVFQQSHVLKMMISVANIKPQWSQIELWWTLTRDIHFAFTCVRPGNRSKWSPPSCLDHLIYIWSWSEWVTLFLLHPSQPQGVH